MSTLSVNAICFLDVDAIEKSKSGHPGVVMGAAPMAYSLYTKHLRVNPAVPNWINRDRALFFSIDLFDVQSDDYKEAILPKAVRRRVAIEMAATQPWYKYVGLDGKVIGIDKFGASAPAAEVIEKIWLHR